MQVMSIDEELVLADKAFVEERAYIDKLSKDEAKEYARKRLVSAGIIMENGEFAQPYRSLGGDNV